MALSRNRSHCACLTDGETESQGNEPASSYRTPQQHSEAGRQAPDVSGLATLGRPKRQLRRGGCWAILGPCPLHGFLQSAPHLSADSDASEIMLICNCFWKPLSHLHLTFFFLSCLDVGGERKIALRSSEPGRSLCSRPHLGASGLERPREEAASGRQPGAHPRTTAQPWLYPLRCQQQVGLRACG